jgi:hypothetical protein
LPYLRDDAQHAPSKDALVQLAKVWLYQHHFLYPGDRPVRDYARHALAASEEGLVRLIRDAIPAATLTEWEHAVLALRADAAAT